jgi:hypothetical protein
MGVGNGGVWRRARTGKQWKTVDETRRDVLKLGSACQGWGV